MLGKIQDMCKETQLFNKVGGTAWYTQLCKIKVRYAIKRCVYSRTCFCC